MRGQQMPSPHPPGHLWRDKWTALSGSLLKEALQFLQDPNTCGLGSGRLISFNRYLNQVRCEEEVSFRSFRF